MSLLKKCSGKDAIKILCNKFGFKIVRRRGSHIVLKKGNVGTVIPDHKELKIPTLRSALKLAKINEKEFVKYQ